MARVEFRDLVMTKSLSGCERGMMRKMKSIIAASGIFLLVSFPLIAEQNFIGEAYNLPKTQSEVRKIEDSATQGNAESQYRLGLSFYYGIEGCVLKDRELAIEWLVKAAKQEHQSAIVALYCVEGVSPATKKRINDFLAYRQKKMAARVGTLLEDNLK
ncbi:MAG: SEL1-like repeat protein (plasmid) [Candidatus Symbiodolus clandestinus]